MPSKCCVVGCSNLAGRDKGVRFFRFPGVRKKTKEQEELTKKRRKAWLGAIRRIDLDMKILKYTRICSDHFSTGYPAKFIDTSHPDWVPNIKMGYTSTDSEPCTKLFRKPTRRKGENNRYTINNQSETEVDEIERLTELENLKSQLKAKDEIIKRYEDDEKKQKETINDYEKKLREKDVAIEKSVQQIRIKDLTIEGLENDDKKVKYFTGLPNFMVLNQLFNYVKDDVSACLTKNLTNFDAFFLTLMKLRLDLPFPYLAYKYGVPIRTISRIFYENVVVIHTQTDKFVSWPDKTALDLSTPAYFKRTLGSRFTAIIHCFEIFTETCASTPELLSSHKHYSSMKYLIAVSPTGAIIFVSNGYEAKFSDKAVVESCGFLDNTEPGDIVLTVRGLLVNVVIVEKGVKQQQQRNRSFEANVSNTV